MKAPFHWITAPAKGKYDPDRDPCGQIVRYCEQLEDEAENLLEEAKQTNHQHQLGFARAQKATAKSIRRHAAEVFRIYRETIRD